MRKVKIVCTLGPATAGQERLGELIAAGMDVARLNLSHGDREGHRRMYVDLRAAADKAGKPVAVLMDLSGPKIRIGLLGGGSILLVPGATVRLVADPRLLGTAERIGHTCSTLARDVHPGDPILLDDGLLQLKVEAIDGEEVIAKVVDGGVLKDRKGMNLPRTALSLPALTDKDREDIAFGRQLGVDYFALSFVRSAQELLEARRLAGPIPVIAKIEKPEAVERLGEILGAADGVMVARGDLGVELGHEKVPLVQKRILREIRTQPKPAITATQMLESMVHNPRPTRAEVSDVANAVLDGTDAVMLSAETSVGEYPVEAVKTLAAVIEEIEGAVPGGVWSEHRPEVLEKTFSSAVADASAEAAQHLGLSAIAVYTESGRSAALVSANRPSAAVVAFSRNAPVLNRLSLFWGVRPLYGAWVKGIDGVVEQSERALLENGLAKPGDPIAITFGVVVGDEPFQTNMLKLWTVRSPR